MGLQADLGYRVRPPNLVQTATQRFAATRPGARLFALTAHHVDAWLLRRTRGRTSLAGVTAGIPVVTVTTTGRRSGQPRPLPLLGVPVGDDLALIGTNFGRASLPAWYLNLAADPHAVVDYRDRRVAVVAREATGDEWESVMRAAAAIYRGYDAYRARIAGRPIPVLVLTPAASGPPPAPASSGPGAPGDDPRQ